jgi:hypothetical protein
LQHVRGAHEDRGNGYDDNDEEEEVEFLSSPHARHASTATTTAARGDVEMKTTTSRKPSN